MLGGTQKFSPNNLWSFFLRRQKSQGTDRLENMSNYFCVLISYFSEPVMPIYLSAVSLACCGVTKVLLLLSPLLLLLGLLLPVHLVHAELNVGVVLQGAAGLHQQLV